MTLCPIALAVGCAKCPAFKICPATRLIGDQPKAAMPAKSGAKPSASGPKAKAKPSAARKKR